MSKQRNMADACWDMLCPESSKDKKRPCLVARATEICDCCQRSGGTCDVMDPGFGLIDICEYARSPSNYLNQATEDIDDDIDEDDLDNTTLFSTRLFIALIVLAIICLLFYLQER